MDDAVFVLHHTGAVAFTNAAVERLLGPAEANFVPQDEDGQPLPDAQTPRARAAQRERQPDVHAAGGGRDAPPVRGDGAAHPERGGGTRYRRAMIAEGSMHVADVDQDMHGA
jgi:hypothetical protein